MRKVCFIGGKVRAFEKKMPFFKKSENGSSFIRWSLLKNSYKIHLPLNEKLRASVKVKHPEPFTVTGCSVFGFLETSFTKSISSE